MSTFSWPSPLKTDQDLTVIGRISLPSPSSPIPSIFLSSGTSGSNWNSPSYLFKETCVQMLANWFPGTLNSLHPDFSSLNAGYSGPNFFLVAEGPRQDIGAGLVQWERTYAAVPATHYEPETYAYPFIGFVGDYYIGGAGVGVAQTGRPRKNIIVTSRVRHDYFLVGLTDPTEAAAANQAVATYSESAQIPSIYALRYYSTSVSQMTLGAEVDDITDPLTVVNSTETNPNLVFSTMSTTPSLSDYKIWMNNAAPIGYRVGTSYATGALVSYQGSNYICIAAISSSLDSTAPTNTSYWSPYAKGGFDGDAVESLQWKGNWLGNSQGISYSFGDQVVYLGKVYTCNHAQGAFANDFPNTSGKWTQIYPSQFVAEDSRISRWNGQIFLRQTRYVLAR